MFVIKYRKIFYALSGLLIITSIISIAVWGLNYGIDFKGGSIIEVEYPQGRPEQGELSSKIADLNLSESIRPTGENGYIIRMRAIDQDEKNTLTGALQSFGTTTEKRFDSIGPVLGTEALRKSIVSIVLVILAIVLFIAFAFRKVSEPVSSWKYG